MPDLGWSERAHPKASWHLRDWSYVFDSTQKLELGELDGLIAFSPYLLKFSDQLYWTFGPYEEGVTDDLEARVWVIYRDEHEQIWVVRSTDDYTDIYDKQLLPWSPQGSLWPSLAFDTNGRSIQAVTFRPAGQEEYEIWISESGQSPFEIAFGIRPVLYRDPDGDILCFYHRDGKVYYRAKSQNYNVEHTLPTIGDGEPTLRAVRTWHYEEEVDGIPYRVWQPVAIYTNSEEPGSFRYLMAGPKREMIVVEVGVDATDAAALSVEFGGIAWEETVKEVLEPVDAAALSVEFDGLNWIGTIRETIEPTDAAALSVEFDDLTWVEITKDTEEPADAAAFSLSEVATLLWIEV